MKSRRNPRDPRNDCGGRLLGSPADMQFMCLLQDLPELQEKCQVYLSIGSAVPYFLGEFIEAKCQPLLPSSVQFMDLENIP